MKNVKNHVAKFKTAWVVSVKMLKLLWKVDKKYVIWASILYSIPAVIPFVNAYIYKLMIDAIIRMIADGTANYSYLFSLVAFRIITFFVQDATFSGQNFLDQWLWNKLPIHLYQMIMGKLANLDVAYFEDSTFRDKLEKVREAYYWRPLNMTNNIFFTIQSLLQVIIALFAIFTLDWIFLALVLLIAIPPFITQTRYESSIWGIWNENTERRKRFYYVAGLIQTGESIKEIKIFQMAPKLLSDMKKIYTDFSRDNIKMARKYLKANLFLNIYSVLLYGGMEAYILISALRQKISVGDISYYTTVIGNFQGGVNGVLRSTTQIFGGSLYIQEIFNLLDIEPKIKQIENSVKVDFTKAPKIEFKNVSFTYPGTTERVFNNFSIMINPGEKAAFVGENGAGKTTFVKLLARFYDVDSGEILINDVNIKNLDLETWYKTIGVLFQDFVRYEYSLEDNIQFGKVYADKNIEEIIAAAKQSGADKVADSLKDGYKQMLGRTFENGTELSTGQWQKVALGRAFLRNAPILILDEPTASIDAKAESEIFEKVDNLSKDKTVLIISHRFSTVRNADRIYVIKKGRIVEQGSHENLMKEKGMYAELFTLQAKGYQ